MALTEFTIENARHLVEMLMSSDDETVELALRTLPGMDYKSYPHVYMFILDLTIDNWWANFYVRGKEETTTVARELDWYHGEQHLKDLHPCEVGIIKALVSDQVNRFVHNLLECSDLSATATVNYNI